MATILPVSDQYCDAIRFAIVLQVPAALVFACVLDGGHLAKIAGYAMIAFWMGVAVILSRRPQRPFHSDLAYIRYGYLPLIAVAGLCAAMLGRFPA